MNYNKIYDDLINKCKKENRNKYNGIYYESHHIIPRCMNGSDESHNLVLLTAKEHWLAHLLLIEIYPNNYKLKKAIWYMTLLTSSQRKYKTTGRQYDRIRNEYILTLKGKFRDEEYRKNISNSKLGSKNGAYGKPSKRAKIVMQYDKEDNFIKEYPNSYEAAKAVNGCFSHIASCCRGLRKHHMKFKWQWKS